MNLNPEQQVVVNSIDGSYVVISGPGSGKTMVLIERHLNMLAKGIPSSQILNLTFTNSAAAEMVKRVGLLNAEQVFRTFHSFALDLLQRERKFVPFEMIDTIIPVRGEDYQLLFDLVGMYPSISDFRKLQQKISEWKRANIEPEQAINEASGGEYYYAKAYEDYEIKCREQGWLDFDSLMREAVKLLETNEDVRNRNKRKYLAIDEAQDCDVVQFKLLQLLFDGNILAVGDENQLIYEFRSAQPGNLSNFELKFPNAKKLFLGQNYRSTKKLVNFFKEILPVDNGIASHMTTENEEGSDPEFVKYPNSDVEVRKVLEQVTDPENTAILARTNRQLFDVQRVAVAKEIKYKYLGKKDFFDQNEIKVLIRLAKESNSDRDASEVLMEIIRSNNLYNRYRNAGDENSDPIENLNNFVKMAAGRGSLKNFLDYIRRLTYGRKSRKEKDLVLSTVHQAKGREWKHVFIIGAEQGRMPHRNGDLTEEKRIFFVAASRAAKSLQISWSGPRSVFIPESYWDKIKAY
jgi:DNA helicase-2/ATP-dependent DNA helicase PcrA